MPEHLYVHLANTLTSHMQLDLRIEKDLLIPSFNNTNTTLSHPRPV